MSSTAIVARSTAVGLEYLAGAGSKSDWAADEQKAVAFLNVREATRAALRLPGFYRAFALPTARPS